jgi:hypothetical protein
LGQHSSRTIEFLQQLALGEIKMNISKTIMTLSTVALLAACGTEMDNQEPPASPPPGGNTVVDEIPARPALGAQIDRMGRPAINTALNNTFNGDKAAKDAAKDSYAKAPQSQWMSFTADFMGSLAILDSLDTVCGNQLLADGASSRYAALAGVLVDDQIYVNSASGECGTYLGLEAEVVGAVPLGAGGCGGRTPADDVIERSYSVLAAGALAGIDDGITQDDGAQTTEFPFLGAPSGSN